MCSESVCVDIECLDEAGQPAEGQMACDGVCQTLNSQEHCGACGNACGSWQTCTEGLCVDIPCEDENGELLSGQKACDGKCIDVTGDLANCGGCGVACESDQKCVSGKCVPKTYIECGETQMACFGTCTDILSDVRNCGTCGRSCLTGEICANGTCELDCGALTKIECTVSVRTRHDAAMLERDGRDAQHRDMQRRRSDVRCVGPVLGILSGGCVSVADNVQ